MSKDPSAAAEPVLRLAPSLARFVSAAAYCAIGVASLVPKGMRPTSGLMPGAAEHFCAYFVLGFIAAFALRNHLALWKLALLNAIYAGGLELFQILVPGRMSTPVDFAASALGSAAGIALLALLSRKFAR